MSKKTIILISVFAILGGLSWSLVLFDKYFEKKSDDLLVETQNKTPDNTIEKLPSALEEVSFIAVGDISFSRGIERVLKNKKDKNYPFANVKDVLQKADFCFGNLETPITSGREIQDGEMIFRSDPGTEKILADANFKILSLANNHTMNFGQAGINDTFGYLSKSNIQYAGAGKNIDEALNPKIIETKGMKIAFLAFNDSDVVPKSYYATGKQAGTAPMDIVKMKQAVKIAKSHADFAVVSMHSGKEYVNEPNESQIDFAHNAIDAGADIVIGHHPHVVQSLEKYKGKYIFYSLGNFIFDQSWSEPTKEAIMLKISLSKTGLKNIIVLPVYTEKYAQPQIELGKHGDEIVKKLNYDLDVLDLVKWDKEKNSFNAISKKYLIKAETSLCGAVSRRIEADIDNDNSKENYNLENGILTVKENDKIIWRSDDSWQVDDFVLADANYDGRIDLNLSVWKSGNFGPLKPFWIEENDMSIRNHFFVYQMGGDKFQPLWQSSNLETPNINFSFFDIDNDDKNELIVSEGDYQSDNMCRNNHIAIWRWQEWGFVNIWRSKANIYENFTTETINNRQNFLLSY